MTPAPKGTGIILHQLEKGLLALFWAVLASLLLYLASLDVLPEVQFLWTSSAIVLMLFLRFRLNKTHNIVFEPLRFAKIMIVLLAGMIALRYIWWRTFHSIPLEGDAFSVAAGLMLYAAEVQAVIVFFLGSCVYLYPKKRDPAPLPDNEESLPTVDVLIPTYNESSSLLRTTLLACKNLRYPADKLNIYMLDDGGTAQKRNDPDTKKAREALFRHQEFKALCQELGVHYLAREKNNNAKAGNINAALQHISGDLVVIFDCDHIPVVDFLENTVASFIKDDKLWLAQTAHFMINDDPIEKNLGKKPQMPSESELFYTSGMRGMDNWNAAFFCGSGAVLRRSCLDELGGICTETVTEDIETSVEMHGRGYNSIYLHAPMLAGLQPETFTGFLTQRLRWTHGMLQVFMMKNPLFFPGLSFWQRVCYFNMTFYWFFSVMRLVFLLSPVLYLVFGIHLYDAVVSDMLIYTIPYFISFFIYFNVMFGKLRWFLVSDLYEVLQSVFAIRTVFQVVLHPERGTFNVTPKDENITQDFITPVANIFHLLLTVLGIALGFGIYKMLNGPPAEFGMVASVFGWCLLSFLIVLGSTGVLHEQRQVRRTTRFKANLSGSISLNEVSVPVHIEDLSSHGMRLLVTDKQAASLGTEIGIHVFCKALDKDITLHGTIQSHQHLSGNYHSALGIDFTPQSIAEEQMIIALAYGDGDRWKRVLKERNVSNGFRDGLKFFFLVAIPRGTTHILNQLSNLLYWSKTSPATEKGE